MPTVAHLHLILVHLPIVGLPAFLIVLNWAAKHQSLEGIKIGLAGLLFFSIAIVGVYLSGQGAEEVVEKFPGIEEAQIEEHEEVAVWALVFGVLTAISAAGALRSLRSPRGRLLLAGTGLFSVLTTGAVLLAATSGGLIRHGEEIAPKPAEMTDISREIRP